MPILPILDLKKTGMRINTLRIAAGLSVKDIQAMLGLTSSQAIYKWLNGLTMPTIDNLLGLSAIFHVSIDDILVHS